MPSTSAKIVMHAVGLLAFVMIGVGVAILYLLIVGRMLGRGGDGFGLTASIFVFPILAFTSGLFCWLPLWLLHNYRVGAMPASRAGLLGLIVGVLISIVIAGPNGFALSGGAPMFSYFTMVITTLGGVVHNWALSRHSARP
jgi:hypothetical protein